MLSHTLHSFLANMYRLWVHWHAYQCNEMHEQFRTVPSAHLRLTQFCKMLQDVQGAKCFKLMLITGSRLYLPSSVIAANGPLVNLASHFQDCTNQWNDTMNTSMNRFWVTAYEWMKELVQAAPPYLSNSIALKQTASLQPSTSRMQQSYCISSYSYYIECNPSTSKGQFPCRLYIVPHKSL